MTQPDDATPLTAGKLNGMKRTAIVCITALLLNTCAGSAQESTPSDAATAPASLPTTAAPLTVVPVTVVPVTAPPSTVAASTTPTAVAQTAGTTTVTSSIPWSGPCGRPEAAPKLYDHVIWIWMENKNKNTVFNSTKAPFLHSLAEACGTASNYVDHGIGPSLPNYLAATSGDTQSVTDDGSPRAHPIEVDNIFRQVRQIGKAAKSYQEAMPANCSLQSTSHYAVKHNPAAYYVGEDDRAACERDDVAFDQFLADLDSGLPAFSLITPDICNDMHDCPVATGDKWLQDVVSAITSSVTYRQARTAVFIVFDESQGGGTMPFVAIAPSIVPGTSADIELDHYSLLAFTEDALGITTRLGHAVDAASMAGAFGI